MKIINIKLDATLFQNVIEELKTFIQISDEFSQIANAFINSVGNIELISFEYNVTVGMYLVRTMWNTLLPDLRDGLVLYVGD